MNLKFLVIVREICDHRHQISPIIGGNVGIHMASIQGAHITMVCSRSGPVRALLLPLEQLPSVTTRAAEVLSRGLGCDMGLRGRKMQVAKAS